MSSLTGTGILVRLILRRDRIRLPVWLLAIVGLVHLSADAEIEIYTTQAAIDAYAQTVGNSPAAVFMQGPPTAVDTMAGLIVFEVSLIAIIGTAMMALFLVIRHTRAEEEAGRAELLRASVVGRYAPVTAVLLVVSAASLAVGLGLSTSLVALDQPTSGSLLYGTSVAALGVLFTMIGACVAQVLEHSRGAVGIGLSVLGASYVLRGIGDVGNHTWSWVSPIGWLQATRPYGDERWWPLLVSVACAGGLLALTFALVDRRDLGAGLLPPRPGPAAGSALLSSPFGLSLRLQRAAVVGWAIALFLLGIAYGSVGEDVRDLLTNNPDLTDFLAVTGTSDLVDAFLSTAVLVLALVASGFAISSALRLRAEETAGRVDPLLATPVSRWRWALGGLAVTAAGSMIVLGSSGLGVGLAHALSSGDPDQVVRLVAASLAYTPAVLVFAGVTVVLFGWLPRMASAAWAYLAVCVVSALLAPLLDIPEWVQDTSPFTHLPTAPVDQVTATPLVVLALVTMALVGAGLLGYRRRDVG